MFTSIMDLTNYKVMDVLKKWKFYKVILYKKSFPLAKGISFFDYITALRKGYFPNFVLAIDKIPLTENYRLQIFFTAPDWRWGLRNSYHERVFLKECMIQHLEGKGYFTLQASPKTENLLFASVQILSTAAFFYFTIFTIVTNDSMSLNYIFGFAIVTIIMLAPLISTYLQDKNLLDKVGSIGKDLERK